MSTAAHLVVAVVLVALSVGGTSGVGRAAGRPRVLQLSGPDHQRPAGPDPLFEILNASDGMPIHLAATGADASVGLAWWSPSTGLWLAVDRLPSSRSNRTLHLTLRVGDGEATTIGPIEIDANGAGKIIAIWTSAPPVTGTSVTLEVSEAGSRWLTHPSLALAGTASVRE